MHYTPFIRGLMLSAALLSPLGFAAEQPPKSLAQQLETAVYAEDVLGDLNQARLLYQQIIDAGNENRVIMAKALLRLGQCQLKTGDGTAAQETFARIKNTYADIHEIVAKVKQIETLKTQEKLALNPVPWQDGEQLEYGVYDSDGHPFVYETRMMRKAPTSHTDTLWKKQIITVHTPSKGTNYGELLINEKNNAMVNAFFKSDSDSGVYISTQGNEVTIDNKNTKNSLKTTRDADALDETNTLETLRRLPYHQDYKESFKVFSPNLLNHLEMNVQVINNAAEITVPAGTFNTHHVRVEWKLQGQKVNEQEIWVSKGQNAKIIQQKEMNNTVKLIKEYATHLSKNNLFQYKNQFTLQLPENWYMYDISPKGSTEMLLVPTPIDAHKIFANIMGKDNTTTDWSKESVEIAAKWAIDWQKGFYQNFMVREDTRKKFTIAGLPAYSYISDYKKNNKDYSEYKIFILDAPRVYDAFFITEKADMETFKPQIDAMLNSLKILKKK